MITEYVKTLCQKYHNQDWIEGAEIALFYAMANDDAPSGVVVFKLTPEESGRLAELSIKNNGWFDRNGIVSWDVIHNRIATLEGGSTSKEAKDPREDHE